MEVKLYLVIAAFLCTGQCFGEQSSHSWPKLRALRRAANLGDSSTQAQAITNLACRLLPNHCKQITIEVNGTQSLETDTFKVSGGGASPLRVEGSSGVAAAWALHRYLREVCNVSISWDGDQLALPETLPAASLAGSSPHKFRYYQNVCTFGYSFVWYDWKRWERELDWMALNGINVALAYVGQEAIWKRVYLNLGLNQTDIDHYFSGPAFLPWNRMGNMRGWGGSLSTAWHKSSVILQKRILSRMRQLGILPILPGFSGIVPKAFKSLFPNADTMPLERWNHFPDDFCCPLFLQPTDYNFQRVGTEYLRELIAVFGTNHLYGSDPFNEMIPAHTGQEYLSNVSRAIYHTMKFVDPKSVWVLQGWTFSHESSYWTPSNIQAFLTAVPRGRILVLDLNAELTPVYKQTESFYGQPFIWCMLHNFGGTLGLYGAANLTNEGLFDTRGFENNTMVGIGITPEGINQNYVMYELMLQLGWETKPLNLPAWFTNYHTRRYGAYNKHADNAWRILKSTVYNNTDKLYHAHGLSVIAIRPQLGMDEPIWYKPDDVRKAWQSMLKASDSLNGSSLFIHDLVDVTRQGLQLAGAALHKDIVNSYTAKNYAKLTQASNDILRLFTDLEQVLATGKNFLLGRWLEAAKACGTTPLEKQVYEFNARNQITLWGPGGEILDYANKQWSGVVSHYYQPRWVIFTSELKNCLANHTDFDHSAVNKKILEEAEEPFTLDRTVFPTEPSDDSAVSVSKALYDRWATIVSHFNPSY